MRVEFVQEPDVFLVHDFLTAAECDEFIARSEAAGYGDAPVTTLAGPVMNKELRDNTRLMVDAPELAERLYERARPHLPARFREWHLCEFNERWRYYRYDVGQRFGVHFDGRFHRDTGEMSHYTFMVYLNDGFEGGETVFHRTDPPVAVKPVQGAALVFYHRTLHEGAPVVSGRKYVLRTDVMYRLADTAPPDAAVGTE